MEISILAQQYLILVKAGRRTVEEIKIKKYRDEVEAYLKWEAEEEAKKKEAEEKVDEPIEEEKPVEDDKGNEENPDDNNLADEPKDKNGNPIPVVESVAEDIENMRKAKEELEEEDAIESEED